MQTIKEAFGLFMSDFYEWVLPASKSLVEFKSRGLSKSIVWAPGRMVDEAEKMLDAWQKDDTDQSPSTSASLPVIIVAFAQDYIPSSRDYVMQVSDELFIKFEDDPKQRVFKLRQAFGDLRAQIVFFGHDEIARALATQFLLYIDTPARRRFAADFLAFNSPVFRFKRSVQLESLDAPAMNIQTEAKNLKILAVDLTLRSQFPFVYGPSSSDIEAQDGKGSDKSQDPHGFKVTENVVIVSKEFSI